MALGPSRHLPQFSNGSRRRETLGVADLRPTTSVRQRAHNKPVLGGDKHMAAFAFTINGKPANVEAEPDTPLLWVVRATLKLTGTKYRSEERRVGKECR